jgi:diguanylate cyclase (GGDEF)-like protein
MEGFNAAALIVLHLVNGDYIRQRLGRDALDGALRHVAAIIISNLQSTDVVGNMGGNDFGLILLVEDMKLAENRGQRLVKNISGQPFLWGAERVDFEVVIGIAMLENNLTLETILSLADQTLLHNFSVHF